MVCPVLDYRRYTTAAHSAIQPHKWRMVACMQGTGIKTQMDEAPRGSVGSLPSPGLEARGGALDPFQRQQLLAAFQSAQRSANQVKIGLLSHHSPGRLLDTHSATCAEYQG